MAYKHYTRLLIVRLCGVVLLPLLIGFLISKSESVSTWAFVPENMLIINKVIKSFFILI